MEKILLKKFKKRKEFNFKTKHYTKKNNIKYKVFTIMLLFIIDLILIYLDVKIRNENYFVKNNNYTKIESSKPNLTLKTINYNKLKNITKNNIKYKGLENCFLYNKEEDYCIYPLLIPKKVINKNSALLDDKNDGDHTINSLLKMDIEYPEWELVSNISEDIIKQFKNLLIEFHFKFDPI